MTGIFGGDGVGGSGTDTFIIDMGNVEHEVLIQDCERESAHYRDDAKVNIPDGSHLPQSTSRYTSLLPSM